MKKDKYLIYTLWVIVATLIFHLIIASSIGLGVDESYTASVSRIFSLGYVDHPPLHYWMIKLSSLLFDSERPIVLRLPFILFSAGTTWMMFLITAKLFNAKSGFFAALVLNLTALFSYMSFGILPDGPLMFFMLSSLYILTKLLFEPDFKNSAFYWTLFGVFSGLAMLSKYHGVFIFFGLFFFAITSRKWRYLFKSVYPYLSIIIASILFSVVAIWNIQHNFASFIFQGSRGIPNSFTLTPLNFIINIAGQIGYILPWIWLPLAYLLIKGLKKGPDNKSLKIVSHQDITWFLCCFAVWPILLFTLPSLWGCKGLPHWQFPGYLMLFPLLGNWIETKTKIRRKLINWVLAFSIAVIVFAWTFIVTQVKFDWISRINPVLFARKDPSHELLDWDDLKVGIDRNNLIKKYNISFIVTANWILAGRIDYIMGGEIPVLTLPNNQHNFALMHDQTQFKGKNALIILPEDKLNDISRYNFYFKTTTALKPIAIFQNHANTLKLNLFLAENYKGY
ncbi:MAG TPA: hypothetical protein DD381_08000 [Lentisphaeria bacterium]|nr:MAG: hypothetical protein A2X47_04565 [Lentisphaerae bacterium GWF2_38_69]HBM16264.1 hypothetical protein [Lentisphaeria bacterium]